MAGPSPDGVDFAGTADQMAAQLREDPVLITDVMGNGHTADLKAALEAKVADAEVPVFVVLTRTPIGMSGDSADEELASLLHARLATDGIYYISTTQGTAHLAVWGDIDPEVDNDDQAVSLAHYTAQRELGTAVRSAHGDDYQLADATLAGLALDIAAESSIPDYSDLVLSKAQIESYDQAMWIEPHDYSSYDGYELPSVGLSAVVATMVGLSVAVVAYRLLQAWSALRRGPAPAGAPPRRRSATDPVKDGAWVRKRADQELQQLQRRLVSPRAGGDRLDLALGSRDTAERLLESEEELDLVGALVLARTGRHALSRKGDVPYRCCYFNPLHGDAHDTVELGSGLTVPACGRCQKDLKEGRTPEALIEVRRWARDLPYYVGDTIWARTGFGALVDQLWVAIDSDATAGGQR